MNFKLLGQKNFFCFARACAYIDSLAMIIAFCIVFQTITVLAADETQFVRGHDSQIHGMHLDYSAAAKTRIKMRITEDCAFIKARPTALPLTGSEDASISARLKNPRGVVVLEGLRPGAEPQPLHTEILVPFRNYPTSIPAEKQSLASTRFPLSITLAASATGDGDLVLQSNDTLTVQTDGQLFNYRFPELTIQSGGLIRLYLATDDQLYYDQSLLHPVHQGPCGRKHS